MMSFRRVLVGSILTVCVPVPIMINLGYMIKKGISSTEYEHKMLSVHHMNTIEARQIDLYASTVQADTTYTITAQKQ